MKNLSLEDLKAKAEELTNEQQTEVKGGYIIEDDLQGF